MPPSGPWLNHLDGIEQQFNVMEEINALQETLPDFAKTDPWTKTPRPHPLTTRLSRFRPWVPITAFSSTPRAQVLYQVLVEVQSNSMAAPTAMAMSSDGSVLAMSAAGDYKSADPILRMIPYALTKTTKTDPECFQ